MSKWGLHKGVISECELEPGALSNPWGSPQARGALSIHLDEPAESPRQPCVLTSARDPRPREVK